MLKFTGSLWRRALWSKRNQIVIVASGSFVACQRRMFLARLIEVSSIKNRWKHGRVDGVRDEMKSVATSN